MAFDGAMTLHVRARYVIPVKQLGVDTFVNTPTQPLGGGAEGR